jgi:hypothetical protein
VAKVFTPANFYILQEDVHKIDSIEVLERMYGPDFFLEMGTKAPASASN